MCEEFGIRKIHTTAEHPQADPAERYIRTFKEVLKRVIEESGGRWLDCVGKVLYSMRMNMSEATGLSPHEVMFAGRGKRLLEWGEKGNETVRRGWEKRVNEWVKTKLTETATKSKDWYDRRWKAKEKDIRVGYEVMVSTKVGAWKGKVRWIGPYKVKKVVNEVNVELEECAGGPELKIHNRVHMNRIKVILTKRKEREEERVIERKEIGYEGGSEDSSEEEWARGFQRKWISKEPKRAQASLTK